MKKLLFVVAVQAGQGLAAGKLFLLGLTGESLKISAKFAAANGIDESYSGLVSYSTEFHKKGAKYIDKDGVPQVYANDFHKLISIVAVKSDMINAEYSKALVKKAVFATAEEV